MGNERKADSEAAQDVDIRVEGMCGTFNEHHVLRRVDL